MKIKIILVLALVLFTIAFFNPAKAQETPQEQPQESSQAVVVATVNIFDAKIVSQENNKVKISFDLSNRTNIQPDVRYSVQLVKQEGLKQTTVDSKIYAESVTLNENQTIKKEIEYLAPAYLNGKFQVWLIAKNQNGMMLALVNPGEITLEGDNQYIEIKEESCYLKVEGEPEGKIYMLAQGVDIKSDEKLIATCDIINHSKDSITFTPQIKTYWRTTFGPEVKDNQEAQPTLTLASQQKRSLSFTLPKADVPQAYDAVMQFKNEQNQTISNQVAFHYVLRGLSATIQNLRLDKDYYQKGDTAKASFFWSASADNFPESRLGKTENGQMQILLTIKNSQNQTCASLQKELDQNISTVEYDLPITSDCPNPSIAVSIQDNQGNVLDKKDFNIESQNAPKPEPLNVLKYGIIFLVVILIISLASIFIIKKRNVLPMAMFVLLAGGIFFLGGEEAKADTFYARDTAGKVHNTYTVNLNKASYSPGEQMTATATGSWHWCGNTSGHIAVRVTINGTMKEIFNRSWRVPQGDIYYDYTNANVVCGERLSCDGEYCANVGTGYCTIDDGDNGRAGSYSASCPGGYEVYSESDSGSGETYYSCRKLSSASQAKITQLESLGYTCSPFEYWCYILSGTGSSTTLTAPSTGGNYNAIFGGCDGFENSCPSNGRWTNYPYPYTVTAPAVVADSCGTSSGTTPRLTEPDTGTAACTQGTYTNSPADVTTSGSQAWRWSCGTVTSCTAPKYGCTTTTDSNYTLPQYGSTGPNNTYGCAATCANGGTNYPTCTAPVVPATACNLSSTLGGGTLASGSSITAYRQSSVACGSICATPITRTCNNGILSGDFAYKYESCSVSACFGCSGFICSPDDDEDEFYPGARSVCVYNCDGTCSTVTSTSYDYTEAQCSAASVTPTIPIVTPTNGACATTHYNCSAGTSTNNINSPSKWTWTCSGLDGGTNASCSQRKSPGYIEN